MLGRSVPLLRALFNGGYCWHYCFQISSLSNQTYNVTRPSVFQQARETPSIACPVSCCNMYMSKKRDSSASSQASCPPRCQNIGSHCIRCPLWRSVVLVFPPHFFPGTCAILCLGVPLLVLGLCFLTPNTQSTSPLKPAPQESTVSPLNCLVSTKGATAIRSTNMLMKDKD